MDVVGEVVELEAEVEVREAVLLGDAVVVDARVLLRDGHHVGHDVEHAGELHPHAVGRGGPGDGQAGRSGGLPARAELGGDVDGRAVEGELEAVDVAEGLDPGEVAAHGGVALADEVRVDVEVGVGDDAEVLVLLSVEVEVVAVAAGEARVAARHAGVEVAHY
uniref:Uncharacterized protein n=1 Tax=Oryza brachyantha TaxID=4533 RepID=J3L884_ORYBR